MTLDEQKAFVEAYDNTFCNISKDRVAKIVNSHLNKLDLSEFSRQELISVIDALGTWHYACAWQIKQFQKVIA
jgi:peroxiredoxin